MLSLVYPNSARRVDGPHIGTVAIRRAALASAARLAAPNYLAMRHARCVPGVQILTTNVLAISDI